MRRRHPSSSIPVTGLATVGMMPAATGGGDQLNLPTIAPWVTKFLEDELKLFDGLSGVSPITEHVIVLKDDRPIKQRYYPKNPAMLKIVNEQVDELLREGCIEPSKSPHGAPIVLVGEKTGETRMCVDFRQLNARSTPDGYPLRRINSILERLRNAKFISTLDLKSGYWQIPMAKQSRECTFQVSLYRGEDCSNGK